MDPIYRLRHVIAPTLGAATILVALFGLGIVPTVAIALGALVWAGAALMLVPRRRFRSLLKAGDLGYDAALARRELETAAGRVRTLRRLGDRLDRLDRPAMTVSLARITASAEAIMRDLERSPRDYRRMRKPLTHYLAHVETIAERYAYMRAAAGPVDPATTQRIERTLADLERVFEDYTRRAVEDEAFDLDSRILLLEQEIKAEGVTGTGPGRTGDRAGLWPRRRG